MGIGKGLKNEIVCCINVGKCLSMKILFIALKRGR